MQLFTPAQAQKEYQKNHDGEIVQIQYLKETLKRIQDSINRETEKFEKMLKTQRALYSEEKDKLKNQIIKLEEKKEQRENELVELLIPIEDYTERAKGTLERVQAKAVSILEREENITELEALLAEKLDDVSDRETILAEKEIKLESKIKGIEEEAQKISESHQRLNKMIDEFESSRGDKLKKLEEKERTLNILEQRNKEYLENRKKELDEKEKALNDRRETLDRAFQRLEKLSIKKY